MKNLGYILTVILSVNVAFAQIQSVDIKPAAEAKKATELPAAVNQTTTVQVQAGAQAQNLPTTYVVRNNFVNKEKLLN
jgi:hypothetical protein